MRLYAAARIEFEPSEPGSFLRHIQQESILKYSFAKIGMEMSGLQQLRNMITGAAQPQGAAPQVTQGEAIGMRPMTRLTGLLNTTEQTQVRQAIEHALTAIPGRLVQEMSAMPPASAEVARRAATTVDALRTDRRQAVAMIAVHAVMESLIQTRNRFWDRKDREFKSDVIDECAQKELQSKLKEKQVKLHMLFGAELAMCSEHPHFMIGVSERETQVLTRLCTTLMQQCRDAPSDEVKPQEIHGAIRGSSLEKRTAVYKAVAGEMNRAFEQVFRAYDERVRGGSLDGVDNDALNRLEDEIKQDTSLASPGQRQDEESWLSRQRTCLANALQKAMDSLPASFTPDERNAWKSVYLKQFTVSRQLRNDQYGKLEPRNVAPRLEHIESTAAALWQLRELRRDAALAQPAQTIALKEAKEWVEQAFATLQSIANIEDGGERAEAPGSGSTENTAKDAPRGAPGSFSDLRQVYEAERVGVPWLDTRRQERIEHHVGRQMTKVDAHHRPAVLDAAADFGAKAMSLLVQNGLRFWSYPKGESMAEQQAQQVVTAGQNNKKRPAHDKEPPADYLPGGYSMWSRLMEPHKNAHAPRSRTADGLKKNQVALPSIIPACLASYTVRHELGHATSWTGDPRPDALLSEHAFIAPEAEHAVKTGKGLTIYSSGNKEEFLADAVAAYLGSPDSYGRTYAPPPPGVGLHSPENLKEHLPKTYELIDEFFRQNFDLERTERSLGLKPVNK